MKYYAGVDIGGMTIKIGIVSKCGNIVETSFIDTIKGENIDKTVERIIEVIDKISIKHKLKIEAIGIGIPGVTNTHTGEVISAVNLGWKNLNIVDAFKRKTNKKIKILNDANAATYGEYKFGNNDSSKIDNFVLVTLGTGIGSGIIINKELYLGNGAAAGELGHIVLFYAGKKCNCGNRGCYEKYASATALMEMIKDAVEKNKNSQLSKLSKEENSYSGKILFDAYNKNCEVANEVIEKFTDYVAQGLVSIINTLHPNVISIGGGVSNAGEQFINLIQKKVDKYISDSGFFPLVEIKKATLMNDAGIIGAAAYVM